MRAVSTLVSTPGLFEKFTRSHECERCTQECVRHVKSSRTTGDKDIGNCPIGSFLFRRLRILHVGGSLGEFVDGLGIQAIERRLILALSNIVAALLRD